MHEFFNWYVMIHSMYFYSVFTVSITMRNSICLHTTPLWRNAIFTVRYHSISGSASGEINKVIWHGRGVSGLLFRKIVTAYGACHMSYCGILNLSPCRTSDKKEDNHSQPVRVTPVANQAHEISGGWVRNLIKTLAAAILRKHGDSSGSAAGHEKRQEEEIEGFFIKYLPGILSQFW